MQAWKITATPRERLQLAVLLLNNSLKVQGRSDERRLHRARQALGLIGISETLLEHQYRLGKNRYQHDSSTRHRFTVTAENAEWILKALEPLSLDTAAALFVEPLLERLERQEDDPLADEALEYDEPTETPRWKPVHLEAPPPEPGEVAPAPKDLELRGSGLT